MVSTIKSRPSNTYRKSLSRQPDACQIYCNQLIVQLYKLLVTESGHLINMLDKLYECK